MRIFIQAIIMLIVLSFGAQLGMNVVVSTFIGVCLCYLVGLPFYKSSGDHISKDVKEMGKKAYFEYLSEIFNCMNKYSVEKMFPGKSISDVWEIYRNIPVSGAGYFQQKMNTQLKYAEMRTRDLIYNFENFEEYYIKISGISQRQYETLQLKNGEKFYLETEEYKACYNELIKRSIAGYLYRKGVFYWDGNNISVNNNNK